MPLTPLDVQKQSFPQKLRGYDPVEVEHFLALVAEELTRRIDEIERLERENRQLRERLAGGEQRERQLQDAILRGKTALRRDDRHLAARGAAADQGGGDPRRQDRHPGDAARAAGREQDPGAARHDARSSRSSCAGRSSCSPRFSKPTPRTSAGWRTSTPSSASRAPEPAPESRSPMTELPTRSRATSPTASTSPTRAAVSLAIGTLLEDGDRTDLAWLAGAVDRAEIAAWFARHGARRLSRRSRALWAAAFEQEPAAAPARAEALWPLA